MSSDTAAALGGLFLQVESHEKLQVKVVYMGGFNH